MPSCLLTLVAGVARTAGGEMVLIESVGQYEYTDYYCAEKGALEIALTPALNETAGKWVIAVADLVAGLTGEASLAVR